MDQDSRKAWGLACGGFERPCSAVEVGAAATGRQEEASDAYDHHESRHERRRLCLDHGPNVSAAIRLAGVSLAARSGPPTVRIAGLVEQEAVFTHEELEKIPGAIDDVGSLAQGFVGGAVPLGLMLERARPRPEADFVTVISDDGHYRASIPLSDLRDKGWMAFRLGDQPLPRDRGGPFRALVPAGSTHCWNVKSVKELLLTTGKQPDNVPARPRH